MALLALPLGTVGEVSGWKLHQLLRTVRRSDHAGVIESSGALVRGSGAPRFTHSAKSAMIFASSFGRFFGICSVSWLCSMDWIRRLFFASPGTMDGPSSPPLSSPSR